MWLLERLEKKFSRSRATASVGELWLYIPQTRLDAHEPFRVASSAGRGSHRQRRVRHLGAFINTIDIKRETEEPDALDIVEAPAPAPAEDDVHGDKRRREVGVIRRPLRVLALPSPCPPRATKNGAPLAGSAVVNDRERASGRVRH